MKAETGTTVTSALLGVPLGGDDGEYSAEVDLHSGTTIRPTVSPMLQASLAMTASSLLNYQAVNRLRL